MSADGTSTKPNKNEEEEGSNKPSSKRRDVAAAEDDDEEEDEDYVPTNNESDDEDGAATNAKDDERSKKRHGLTSSQRRRVNDAFESLFRRPNPYDGDGVETTTTTTRRRKRRRDDDEATRTKRRVLTELFGDADEADRLLSTAADVVRRSETGRRVDRHDDDAGRRLAVPETRIVTEVRRFAGKDVAVEKVVTVLENHGNGGGEKTGRTTATTAAAAPTVVGLDGVLAELSKPQNMSTIAKTSSDWDVFKDRNNLEEELEKKAQGKDAYLVKRDFLNRVDQRRFEEEKKERDRKRSAAGM